MPATLWPELGLFWAAACEGPPTHLAILGPDPARYRAAVCEGPPKRRAIMRRRPSSRRFGSRILPLQARPPARVRQQSRRLCSHILYTLERSILAPDPVWSGATVGDGPPRQNNMETKTKYSRVMFHDASDAGDAKNTGKFFRRRRRRFFRLQGRLMIPRAGLRTGGDWDAIGRFSACSHSE